MPSPTSTPRPNLTTPPCFRPLSGTWPKPAAWDRSPRRPASDGRACTRASAGTATRRSAPSPRSSRPSAAASSSNHRPHDLGHPTRSRPGVSPASAGAAFYHVQFQGIGIPAITSTIRRPNRRARRCAVRVACSPPGVVGFRRCWFGCVVGGFGWCRVWDEVADAFGEVLGASGYAVLVAHGGLWVGVAGCVHELSDCGALLGEEGEGRVANS